jgi:hypothetical protein
MLKKIERRFYFLAVFLLSNLLVLSALAQTGGTGGATGGTGGATGGTGGPSIPLTNPLGDRTIMQIINGILNYFIYISVPILAFFILWGGFQILTAREDPEKVKNGRKTIMWASIGFAIILCSKGVALILLKILGG